MPTRHWLLLAAAAGASGCPHRPKAPPLTTEAVYQNDELGVRFLAPAGWNLQSRANVPPGGRQKPIVLVSYQRQGGEKPADFKVVVAEPPEGEDLHKFLIDNPVGADKWTPHPPPEAVTVNGAEATRLLLTRVQAKDEIRREVTAFRRGPRVFFFLVTFAVSDAGSRDAVRTAVASVAWTK